MSFHVGGAMFIIAGFMYCLLHLPYFGTAARIAKNNGTDVIFVDENGDIRPDGAATLNVPFDERQPPLPVSVPDLSLSAPTIQQADTSAV